MEEMAHLGEFECYKPAYVRTADGLAPTSLRRPAIAPRIEPELGSEPARIARAMIP
jgi:hypothetical protein